MFYYYFISYCMVPVVDATIATIKRRTTPRQAIGNRRNICRVKNRSEIQWSYNIIQSWEELFTAIVVGSKGDKSLVYSFVLQGIHLYTRRTHFGVRVSENISVAAVAFLESFLHQQDLTHYNCLVFSSSVQVRSAAKSRKLTVQSASDLHIEGWQGEE